jgi:hypothetical protein
MVFNGVRTAEQHDWDIIAKQVAGIYKEVSESRESRSVRAD